MTWADLAMLLTVLVIVYGVVLLCGAIVMLIKDLRGRL